MAVSSLAGIADLRLARTARLLAPNRRATDKAPTSLAGAGWLARCRDYST
jgi:hypothetical protein